MQFQSLSGLTNYEEARRLQLELLDKRARDEIPDTVLFLEHEPVITRGRGLQFTGETRERHMPVPADFPPGIAFCETERGGDLTYHGPGQLVVYPIVKLDGTGFGPERDVTAFLRKLESVLARGLARISIEAHSRENAGGVWVGNRKLASIGIAVRKWVVYHGIAMNCVNDLAPFRLFSPCGFSHEVMTSVRELRPRAGDAVGEGWRAWWERVLREEFESAN